MILLSVCSTVNGVKFSVWPLIGEVSNRYGLMKKSKLEPRTFPFPVFLYAWHLQLQFTHCFYQPLRPCIVFYIGFLYVFWATIILLGQVLTIIWVHVARRTERSRLFECIVYAQGKLMQTGPTVAYAFALMMGSIQNGLCISSFCIFYSECSSYCECNDHSR